MRPVDFFFVLDGDLNIYLIPARVIAGRVTIVLRSYSRYITGNAAGLGVPGLLVAVLIGTTLPAAAA